MTAPTFVSCTPNVGRTGGAQLLRVRGTGFRLPPAPGPLGSAQAALPTVEVLFGTRRAREVRVLSSELLHVVTPIGDAGLTSITIRNVDDAGAPIAGESITVQNVFAFKRPELARKPSQETTLQRVVGAIIFELRRQIVENTVLTTHTDYDDTPDGANVAALSKLPGLVLSGPRLEEDRELSSNQARVVTLPDGRVARLRPARTVDMEFTLIGVDELQQPMLALMSECEAFFMRNTELVLPVDVTKPDGPTVGYEIDMVRGSHFAPVGNAATNSNIRAFSGTFRVLAVDLDDDDMVEAEQFPITDTTRLGVAASAAVADLPSPAVLLRSDGTGPAGVVLSPPLVQGPSNPAVGMPDGIQQIPPEES